MKVLSLFDGMSCGQIALNRIGIKPDVYYASELDKYAIQVTQANWPDTVQLGDVTKWREWDLPWGEIDLLIGGSPCQGFSFAGKQLAFDDPRSKLFFVYVDILNHIRSVNPNVKFMLENVKMKKEHLAVISEQLGVEPVFINSALVSAQNRQRYYWANWVIKQPADLGIVLADIIEGGADMCGMAYNRKDGLIKPLDKSYSLNASDWRGLNRNQTQTAVVDREKAHCLDANYHKGGNPEQYFNKNRRQLVFINQKGRGNNPGGLRALDGKTPSMTSNAWEHNNHLTDGVAYRKLTPVECERLQTVPDNYTAHVSNTQRYKMLGNGWTVDVIAHIFRSMK
jgi:DNA-cytosine methyltransferase